MTYPSASTEDEQSNKVYLKENDQVISGYIAEDGAAIIEVSATAQNSTISKIVHMVEEASASKAHTEKFIARKKLLDNSFYLLLIASIGFLCAIFIRAINWFVKNVSRRPSYINVKNASVNLCRDFTAP